MNYVELFAGCGGLSLGLKSTGGKMLLANELSPMASETFSFNLLGEPLTTLAKSKILSKGPILTKWLSSKYELQDMTSRLSENPQEFPPLGKGVCDLRSDGRDLAGSMVVGSVVELNRWLNDVKNKTAMELLRNGFGEGNIDLVSGGPPCQSFSMAGMRQYTNARNVLPWEFAKFVQLIQPKFALLENVTGILRPFVVEGKKVYAWFEVAQAFAQIGMEPGNPSCGYVPICLHVNAKFAGVAQNRPRFIMLSIRKDVYDTLRNELPMRDREILNSSKAFFEKIRKRQPVELKDLPLHDADKNPSIFLGTFLKGLVNGRPTSVREAIDDLRSDEVWESAYVKSINTILSRGLAGEPKANHDFRRHCIDVKRRFRIYQVLSKVRPETATAAFQILKRKKTTLDDAAWGELRAHAFYLKPDGAFTSFGTKAGLEDFLMDHETGKHKQKAMVASMPAPAALSIPDDMCHYYEDQDCLRTLTVREMARIQSFPDKFTFCSKATTGGKSRRFEVPQYTQVGNAVPPLLGRALGLIVQDLLDRYHAAHDPMATAKAVSVVD
ncbi:DNA cytosine methyltransferase [Massilia rubra]|uniref:DNA (cytosine-5-)-methyltransferase n=1 Tax=Massilia rubra TaxID=2607910 RepID=A0ABX0LDQ6_9BURK|nr:DNA cytosine methyltransferase [Massilia rubra]NHZ32983.1 DNA cytosine methyltransferase [Massilia rubra]